MWFDLGLTETLLLLAKPTLRCTLKFATTTHASLSLSFITTLLISLAYPHYSSFIPSPTTKMSSFNSLGSISAALSVDLDREIDILWPSQSDQVHGDAVIHNDTQVHGGGSHVISSCTVIFVSLSNEFQNP